MQRNSLRLTDLELTRARPLRAGSATCSVALCEPRKRRATERPRVGCCDELGDKYTWLTRSGRMPGAGAAAARKAGCPEGERVGWPSSCDLRDGTSGKRRSGARLER